MAQRRKHRLEQAWAAPHQRITGIMHASSVRICAVLWGIEGTRFAAPTAAHLRPKSRIGKSETESRRLVSFIVQRCPECDQSASCDRNYQRHCPVKCDPRHGRYRRYDDHERSHGYSSKPLHILSVMIQRAYRQSNRPGYSTNQHRQKFPCLFEMPSHI